MNEASTVEFFEKLKEWPKQLESEKTPTLWMVWPNFINLNRHFHDKPTDTDAVKMAKEVGRAYIQKNLSDIAPRMLHKISTVLHPLLKNIAMASNDERNRVYNDINDDIKKDSESSTKDLESETNVDSINQDILFDFMGTSSLQDAHDEELDRYLHVKVQPMNPYEFDLLGWWFGNRHTLPKLFKYFVSLAGITASSSSQIQHILNKNGNISTTHPEYSSLESLVDLVLARNALWELL